MLPKWTCGNDLGDPRQKSSQSLHKAHAGLLLPTGSLLQRWDHPKTGHLTVMQFCRAVGKSAGMSVCGKQMKCGEAGEQWKRGLEWKDTWEALGIKLQGVDRKEGKKKSYAKQNCVVWKVKIWGRAGTLLLSLLFPSFPGCQITLCPFLNKCQFLPLCSSHTSPDYPSFCLQLMGFFGTYLLACVGSNGFSQFLLGKILFPHTERRMLFRKSCYPWTGQRTKSQHNYQSLFWKGGKITCLCEDVPADIINLLCTEECKNSDSRGAAN